MRPNKFPAADRFMTNRDVAHKPIHPFHPPLYQVSIPTSPLVPDIPHRIMRSHLDSPPYPARFPDDAPSRGIDADDAIRGTDDDALTSRLYVSSYGVLPRNIANRYDTDQYYPSATSHQQLTPTHLSSRVPVAHHLFIKSNALL